MFSARLTGLTIFAVLCVAPAFAQHTQFNGVYTSQRAPGVQLLVEGVPWNDGESLTVMMGDKEISAFRKNPRAPYVYNQDGCVVTINPQRVGGKVALAVDGSDGCNGDNAMFANFSATFVRR